MGTNFYKVMPISKRVKDKLKEKIDKEEFRIDKYGNISFNSDDELNNLPPNIIHIGKRSAGWKFLFDCNDWKYFSKNEQSLLNWIYDNSDNSYIEDEYGNRYSSEEFMKEVDETYTPWINGEERYDHTTYNVKHPNEYHIQGVTDMYLGKYRVSTYTDFS